MSNRYLIPPVSEGDPRVIQLATRRGQFIKNEQMPARSKESMKAAKELVKQGHPEAIPRSAASTYNCMGLAFGSRRTGIDPDQWEKIRDDDGYRKVSVNNAVPGDVVIYRETQGHPEVAHVAVIVDVQPDVEHGRLNIRVISQWGRDGEYLHMMEDVNAYLGKPVEIWSERVSP